MRAGVAYDVAELRPRRGAVVYRLFGPAVDLVAGAVVGPGILLVVELDGALAVDGENNGPSLLKCKKRLRLLQDVLSICRYRRGRSLKKI